MIKVVFCVICLVCVLLIVCACVLGLSLGKADINKVASEQIPDLKLKTGLELEVKGVRK